MPKTHIEVDQRQHKFFYIFFTEKFPGHTPFGSILQMKPYLRSTKIIKARVFCQNSSLRQFESPNGQKNHFSRFALKAAKLPEGPAKGGAAGRVLRTTLQSSLLEDERPKGPSGSFGMLFIQLNSRKSDRDAKHEVLIFGVVSENTVLKIPPGTRGVLN